MGCTGGGSAAADVVHGWILLAKQSCRHGLLTYAHGVREVDCTTLHHMLKCNTLSTCFFSGCTILHSLARIPSFAYLWFLSKPTVIPVKVKKEWAARGLNELGKPSPLPSIFSDDVLLSPTARQGGSTFHTRSISPLLLLLVVIEQPPLDLSVDERGRARSEANAPPKPPLLVVIPQEEARLDTVIDDHAVSCVVEQLFCLIEEKKQGANGGRRTEHACMRPLLHRSSISLHNTIFWWTHLVVKPPEGMWSHLIEAHDRLEVTDEPRHHTRCYWAEPMFG